MDLPKMAADQGLTLAEFVEIVDILIEATKNDLQKIRRALDQGDGQAIGEAAHSIKGAAGNMGFADLAAGAQQLEKLGQQQQLTEIVPALATLEEQVRQIETGLPQTLGN